MTDISSMISDLVKRAHDRFESEGTSVKSEGRYVRLSLSWDAWNTWIHGTQPGEENSAISRALSLVASVLVGAGELEPAPIENGERQDERRVSEAKDEIIAAWTKFAKALATVPQHQERTPPDESRLDKQVWATLRRPQWRVG